MNPEFEPHARALVEEWRVDFIGVIQAMGDISPEMVVHYEPPVRADNMLWWEQPLDLAAGASIWIGAEEQTWSTMGRCILTAIGVELSSSTELTDTYLEVLRQSLGVLATGVGARLGREIAAVAGSQKEPAGAPIFSCQIAIKIGDQQLPRLAFYLSQEVLDALQGGKAQGDELARQTSQLPNDDPDHVAELTGRACGTLDLLLDVEMPVSVSFGRTQVRIQDLLKLITGSIIELDRAITEPVEVIVNNCIIARGEVVVVDGNYGVRIKEIMSRRERLRESRKYLLPAVGNRR